MNVLIIGGGGREHALSQVISKSNKLTKLFAIPGNPGIAKFAKCVDINPLNNQEILKFSLEKNINLVIPGSEVYLENGITDTFSETDILVFGPTKAATQIESSKKFAKELMKKYNIPTANYEIFNNFDKAKNYVLSNSIPTVIKYDGLAFGKGVVVANSVDEAIDALKVMLLDKKYGDGNVIIEEFLDGEEFSLMTFVHDELMIPMPIAQDYKRLSDNDLGPNTGGMGVYSPVPIIDKSSIEFSINEILKKTVEALYSEKIVFTGFLYGGLILTKEGPKVIEFNARFGDPEAEVILPKLESDILLIVMNLFDNIMTEVKWSNKFHLGVVMASNGYPSKYLTKFPINGIDDTSGIVFQMGTILEDDILKTNGGRVLLVTGEGMTLKDAQERAYNNILKIKCENLIYRKDIGNKSLRGRKDG